MNVTVDLKKTDGVGENACPHVVPVTDSVTNLSAIENIDHVNKKYVTGSNSDEELLSIETLESPLKEAKKFIEQDKSILYGKISILESFSRMEKIAKLLHQLQAMFVQAAAAEAEAVIHQIFQQVHSLLAEANTILRFAKEVKSEATKSFLTKVVTGSLSIGFGCCSFGCTAKAVAPISAYPVDKFGQYAHNLTEVGRSTSAIGDGVGMQYSIGSQYGEKEGTSAQKKEQAIQSEIQAQQQRNSQYEQEMNKKVQELKQAVEQLLQELLQALKACGRNFV